MSNRSFKIASGFFLVCQTIDGKAPPPKPVEQPTNHILMIDCSGSMTGDLPEIRAQLKRKLPKLLREKDTVSIVWFSGRGQFGVLLEAEPVATLVDLQTVEQAIDRWLKPIGLTGFREPIEEIPKLIQRVGKKTPGNTWSLFFMSDGCDNQWSRPEILKAVEQASGGLAASTFVEYGFYADRALLAAMAEKAGGQHIFADRFDAYDPIFEASMKKHPVGGKRIELTIHGDPIGGFDWVMTGSGADGELTTYGVENGKISVPEETREVWYLSPTSIGETMTDLAEIAKNNAHAAVSSNASSAVALSAAYAAISLFSVRMRPDILLPILGALGDVAMIEDFGGLFGKERYSAFMDQAKAAAFDRAKRYAKGYNPKALPKDDAFTVLDMMRLLASDDENRVLLDHPKFTYRRISRARFNADLALTDDEQAEVEKLTKEIAKTKNAAKVKALTEKIDAIMASKKALSFESPPCPEGYAVENLTYNEENPNVSILVRKEGTVDVTSRAPEAVAKRIPAKFPTFIWRNYAVIKDGLVNVETLPCKLSKATVSALLKEAAEGRLPDDVLESDGEVMLLHFKTMPVVNRTMVRAMSAKLLFTSEWELLKVQGEQKVYNTLIKELGAGKKSQSFEEAYGQEAADWLREQGFTDYGGFNPKQVQAEVRDFYRAKELKVAVKSFSSLPSLNEFRKAQAAKKKLTPSAALLEPGVKAATGHEADEAWLKAAQKKLDKRRRELLRDKAINVFGTVVGQVWFTEFNSMDENSMSLVLDGQKLDFKVEMKEVEVKI